LPLPIDLLGGRNSVITDDLTINTGSFNQDMVIGGVDDRGSESLDLTQTDFSAVMTWLRLR
jgi:hypothetical protein